MEDVKGKSNKETQLSKDSAIEGSRHIFTANILALHGSQLTVAQALADRNRVFDSFQKQLSEKEEKIENLEQKVKKLERENTYLKEEVKSKEREITDLKKKVNALESSKKKLQEEVKKLKTKAEELETEINHLQAQMECLQAEKEDLTTQMDKLRRDMIKRIEDVSKDLDESNRDKARLQKQLDQMELKLNRTFQPGQDEEATLETEAILVLGEMCHQLQNKMYQEVLPDNFSDDWNHKVKDINKDIEDEEILETDEERDEAAKRWGYLRERIGWDDRLTKTISSLVQKRNVSAHPSISEEYLRWALDEMEAKFPKKGYQSAEKVKKLVDMWSKFHAQ